MLTLSGTNSYNGSTQLSAGTLQLGNAAALPATTALTANSGVLDLNANSVSVSSLSGSAGIITDNYAFSSGTTTFTVNQAGSTTFGGKIADGPNNQLAVTMAGTGTLMLSGSNTFSGPTTIAAGTLQIGNGGSGERLASLVVVDSGTLAFNHADALTYAGVIGGPGALTKNGLGMLTLLGNNTYRGNTTISAGTLSLGNGGATGLLGGGNYTATIANSGALVVNTLSNQTFSGVISGGGGLYQLGSGQTILSASNSFTGNITISGGTLQDTNSESTGGSTPSVSGLGNVQTVGRTVTINNGGMFYFGTGNALAAANPRPS